MKWLSHGTHLLPAHLANSFFLVLLPSFPPMHATYPPRYIGVHTEWLQAKLGSMCRRYQGWGQMPFSRSTRVGEPLPEVGFYETSRFHKTCSTSIFTGSYPAWTFIPTPTSAGELLSLVTAQLILPSCPPQPSLTESLYFNQIHVQHTTIHHGEPQQLHYLMEVPAGAWEQWELGWAASHKATRGLSTKQWNGRLHELHLYLYSVM
jgi:hypothetical protein